MRSPVSSAIRFFFRSTRTIYRWPIGLLFSLLRLHFLLGWRNVGRRVLNWRLHCRDAGSHKRSSATTFYPCRPSAGNASTAWLQLPENILCIDCTAKVEAIIATQVASFGLQNRGRFDASGRAIPKRATRRRLAPFATCEISVRTAPAARSSSLFPGEFDCKRAVIAASEPGRFLLDDGAGRDWPGNADTGDADN